MLKKILVPLDGSLRAERVLPVAACIARASEGSILLLQVVSPPIDYGSGLAPVPFVTGELIKAELKEADSYLKTVASSQVLTGIQTSTEVLYGFAAQQLLSTAQDESVDLIVMGSHGRTGLTRWILGSVAHKLTHESAVPVLVLRDKGRELCSPHPDARGRLTRAFVSLDGSELADAVLRPTINLVIALSAPSPAALHLMQVVKMFPNSEEHGT
ncbi:MAG TPA: universal stress protein, partial [Ktedonobacteraceae bacterium]|nr:universal stress protein [Ktedonobacteraceae bacterium]